MNADRCRCTVVVIGHRRPVRALACAATKASPTCPSFFIQHRRSRGYDRRPTSEDESRRESLLLAVRVTCNRPCHLPKNPGPVLVGPQNCSCRDRQNQLARRTICRGSSRSCRFVARSSPEAYAGRPPRPQRNQGNRRRKCLPSATRPKISLSTTCTGCAVTLSSMTAKSPVVLVVLRGYPGYQCPICSIQVGGLIGNAKELADAGARVVLVYPGAVADLNQRGGEFLKGKNLPEHFAFVTDPDYKFTTAWGLRGMRHARPLTLRRSSSTARGSSALPRSARRTETARSSPMC